MRFKEHEIVKTTRLVSPDIPEGSIGTIVDCYKPIDVLGEAYEVEFTTTKVVIVLASQLGKLVG